MADRDHAPEEIACEDDVFDLAFHPTHDFVAFGTISGVVQVYQYSEDENKKLLDLRNHQEAIRSLYFAPDGQSLFTASADKSIRAYDTNGNATWAEMRAHDHAVNRLYELSTNVFASGDDMGTVKIWDTRQHQCVATWKEHEDFISGFATNPANDTLLSTGGDGRLTAYDLRKNEKIGKSDELDDELLSVSVIKNGRKIVCGSQDGVLVIFSWGTWGDMSDRFPGHPDSVDALLKVDEDTVLTGSSDGLIRIVQIQQSKLLGVLGHHEHFPVEEMAFSRDQRLVGSISHTSKVHFWDVGFLYDEDDGEDEEVEDGEPVPMDMEMTVADESDSSDSDDEEFMSANHGGGRQRMPTRNELFFSDL